MKRKTFATTSIILYYLISIRVLETHMHNYFIRIYLKLGHWLRLEMGYETKGKGNELTDESVD